MANELSHEGLEAWKGILIAHSALVETLDRVMAEANLLPLDWYDVLLALEDAPDHKLKMSELADQVLLSKSGLTRLVDRMVAKGYICRQGCPSDRRVAYAKITEAGLQARERSWPTYRAAIHEHFARHLSSEEAKIIGESLQRFTGRFRQRGSCAVGESQRDALPR